MYVVNFPGCCGALILHGLYEATYANLTKSLASTRKDLTIFAVTSPGQTGPTQALKAYGFKALPTFPSSHGGMRELTPWMLLPENASPYKAPPRKPRAPKAPAPKAKSALKPSRRSE